MYPELKNLYNILEVDFHPLKLYERIKTCMEFIGQNDDLAQYVPALEDIIVTRVLKQVPLVCLYSLQIMDVYGIIKQSQEMKCLMCLR